MPCDRVRPMHAPLFDEQRAAVLARFAVERKRVSIGSEVPGRELVERARVADLVLRDQRERDAFLLLAEDFEDHAASASTTARTHASCSRNFLRNSSRSCVFGPCPVTTCLSSSQSGSLYSQTPSSLLRSFGSGTVSPSSQICGT